MGKFFTIDLGPHTDARLRRCVVSGEEPRTKAVRRAICLYAELIRAAEDGYSVQIVGADNKVVRDLTDALVKREQVG